ncbi:MAG: papain-like cysteine protease family protein [Alphaproteobacteria bacterium]|nr:papain-like cysteine protease family protein [Alphaproteobacteria bacterium]
MTGWQHLSQPTPQQQPPPPGGGPQKPNRKRWGLALLGLVVAVAGVDQMTGGRLFNDSGSNQLFQQNANYQPNTGVWQPKPGEPIPPPVDLPIQNLRQETQVWCWAAVSQQIIYSLRGQQNTPAQCALVAMANGAEPGVCCNGYNQQCVTTGSLDQIRTLIQQFGGRPSSIAEPTDPMTLYKTLASGHPVIIAIQQQGTQSGHVIVVRGMSFVQTQNGVEPVLHINDPMAVYTQPVPFRQLAQMWKAAIIVN